MRKILGFILLIISVNVLGQTPTGYQYRTVREKLIAFMVDSGLHVPRYNGTPSGVRSGVSVQDGAIAMDTTNHRFYIYSGGAWVRMASYAELTALTDTHFGNTNLTQTGNRTFTGGGFDYTLTGLGHWGFNLNSGKSFYITSGFFNKLIIDPDSRVYAFGDISGEHNNSFWYLNATSGSERAILNIDNFETFYTEVGRTRIFGRSNPAFPNNESLVDIYTDSIILRPSQGNLYIDTLEQATEDYQLFFDPTTGKVTYEEASSGSGTANTNVGSGYRWLKPTPQEIKTAFNGNGILIDSSSNTDGLTFKVDTTVASATSNTTNLRLQKIIDSLAAAGAFENSIFSQSWYKYKVDVSGASQSFMYITASGTAASVTALGTPPYTGWPVTQQFQTGSTSVGLAYGHLGNSGVVGGIAFETATIYNYGIEFAVEDLSDGTETYALQFGFGDHTVEASIADGAWFWYTHGDSSGKLVCKTRKTSGSTTAVATNITLAADTRYFAEISVDDNHAYFYINKVLVADITTNIPNGLSETTSIVNLIKKTNGSTARKLYVRFIGYGDMTQ